MMKLMGVKVESNKAIYEENKMQFSLIEEITVHYIVKEQ